MHAFGVPLSGVLIFNAVHYCHSLSDPLQPHSITADNGVVTVPLIPHHVQERQRLEQGLIDESTLAAARIRRDPVSRYARFLEQEDGNSRNLREADQVAELFQGYGVRI